MKAANGHATLPKPAGWPPAASAGQSVSQTASLFILGWLLEFSAPPPFRRKSFNEESRKVVMFNCKPNSFSVSFNPRSGPFQRIQTHQQRMIRFSDPDDAANSGSSPRAAPSNLRPDLVLAEALQIPRASGPSAALSKRSSTYPGKDSGLLTLKNLRSTSMMEFN